MRYGSIMIYFYHLRFNRDQKMVSILTCESFFELVICYKQVYNCLCLLITQILGTNFHFFLAHYDVHLYVCINNHFFLLCNSLYTVLSVWTTIFYLSDFAHELREEVISYS